MIRWLAITAMLALAACSGFDEARRMPPAEIATLTNTEVCGYLRTFAYKGRVPEAWGDEAVRRGLTRCIDEGIQRRADDRKLETLRPTLCTSGASTQDSRCW